jgi:3-mercaptopyruvate sulfurtransferase SseA
MIENGYLSVYALEGGWAEWREADYPVEAR